LHSFLGIYRGMEVKALSLTGLLEIRPTVYRDKRGYFFESFNSETFRNAGIGVNFVQDNQSFSVKGTVRGLHYQAEPHAQGKLIWVASGRVLDVMVDIRKDSPDFGKYLCIELDSRDFRMLYIPPGFAHGFSALEDSIFQYKCTSLYHKESERGINPLDSTLSIDWRVENPIISDKDSILADFNQLMPA
jgi:dTDP-4-dehydrorhamnose 3,5-epimerase